MNFTQLDRFLDEYCQTYEFSGNLRITHRDNILYQRCMGLADRENNLSLTEDSLFQLYSLSKPFCAIGLLLLVDRGLVDLEAHPGKYVPEAAGFDPRVTVRQMLHHTSGLPDLTQYPEFVAEHPYRCATDYGQLVSELAKYPQNFAPGSSTHYANINFLLPARIIEAVTGLSYAEYMAREVFAPLGMKTARVDREGLLVPNRCRGYDVCGDSIIAAPDRHIGWMFGAGDILGTLDDVYCLNLAIKHRKLLRPETWKQVLSPSAVGPFGMGCTIYDWHGKHRITHNGGATGFRTLHVQLPEDDFDIILLSNCGFGNSRVRLAEAIYAICFGTDNVYEVAQMDAGFARPAGAPVPDALNPALPKRVPLTPEEESRLLGTYDTIRLEKHGEDYCIVDDWRTLLCYPTGNGTFAHPFIDEQYRIEECEDGTLTLLGHRKTN